MSATAACRWQSRAVRSVTFRASPSTAALRCNWTAGHVPPQTFCHLRIWARSSQSPNTSGAASRERRDRQPASPPSSVSAAASILAFPIAADAVANDAASACPDLEKDLPAKASDDRAKSDAGSLENLRHDRAPDVLSAAPLGACKDGFCSYSQEQQDAWERQQKKTEEVAKGSDVPTLAGLSVATLQVKTALKVEPCSASTPSQPASGRIQPAAHPDVERRRREREARKALRRGSSIAMSQKEWWKASASNLVEIDSPSAFDFAIKSAASHGRTVVVDYYAPWCQACARQFPVIVAAAMANPNIIFLKVNAGNLRAMCEAQGVQRLPSYAIVKPGKQLWRTGFIKKLQDTLQAEARKAAE